MNLTIKCKLKINLTKQYYSKVRNTQDSHKTHNITRSLSSSENTVHPNHWILLLNEKIDRYE